MDELEFETTLSMEEIERNFQDVDLFSELMKSLQEVLAIEKGEKKMDTVCFHVRDDGE